MNSADCFEENSFKTRWQNYWGNNGEQLVWESWHSKYSDYIDPYFSGTHAVGSGTTADPRSADNLVNPSDVNSISAQQLDNIAPSLPSRDTTDAETKDIPKMTDISVTMSNVTSESAESPSHVESWNQLWNEHYNEVYWYYYDWFMQWVSKESTAVDDTTAVNLQCTESLDSQSASDAVIENVDTNCGLVTSDQIPCTMNVDNIHSNLVLLQIASENGQENRRLENEQPGGHSDQSVLENESVDGHSDRRQKQTRGRNGQQG